MSATLKMANIEHLILEKSGKIGGQIGLINNSLDDLIVGNIDSGNDLNLLLNEFQNDKELPVVLGCEVLEVDTNRNLVHVSSSGESEMYEYENLVIATGCRLNTDARFIDSLFAEDIYYRISDKLSDFQDGNIMIIGSGDNAAFAALKLKNIAKNIIMVSRSSDWKIREDLLEELKVMANVSMITNSQLLELSGEKELSSCILSYNNNIKTLNIDKIIFKIGYVPNTEFIGDSIRKNELNHIIVDKNFQSSVPNVFAIGDIVADSYKRISISLGHGTFLANYIIKNKL
ncbi:MAG: NAD(P)/FAD-dependent oxidoreductase [Saprospiraceae bacterium]